MHAKPFIHELLSSVTHQKRLRTLVLSVEAAIRHKKLSLTSLGRSLSLPIQERSAIKRIDRLLGNSKLHQERLAMYQACSHYLLSHTPRPSIIVDWSHIPNTTSYVLRAAVVLTGRALSVYEEVYPQEKLGNTSVQIEFLNCLKLILPPQVKPIILTDAGFYNDWFKAVEELGWDYLGRLRGSHRYYDGQQWLKCLDTFKCATNQAKALGTVMLCKRNPIKTNLYLMKELLKGKHKKAKTKNTTNSESYRKSANDPWLLASSLSKDLGFLPKKIMACYKNRMQIEEGFRDLKSSQFGLSFEHAASKIIERIQILLLIAMLASLLAYITGFAAEKMKLHFQFQANSIRHRRVLSYFFLGCRIIFKKLEIPVTVWDMCIREIQLLAGT